MAKLSAKRAQLIVPQMPNTSDEIEFKKKSLKKGKGTKNVSGVGLLPKKDQKPYTNFENIIFLDSL